MNDLDQLHTTGKNGDCPAMKAARSMCLCNIPLVRNNFISHY